jgi:formylglycine-generating enzyme required for sulfatase activity
MTSPAECPIPEMVLLDGGTFIMGSTSGQEDEDPPHPVRLSPFYIARFAVTNREYGTYFEQAGILPPPFLNDTRFNHPDQPVVAVNWDEAVAYCLWLGKLLDKEYRLPTEAEREYACRAGTSTAYPWGDNPARDCGEYGRRWLAGGPEIVGGPTNAFGLCNMSDNVHEWCLDWYGRNYYRHSPCDNPRGPDSGVRRASRGGSWRHQVKVTRSSARSAIAPGFRYADYGFRVARSG